MDINENLYFWVTGTEDFRGLRLLLGEKFGNGATVIPRGVEPKLDTTLWAFTKHRSEELHLRLTEVHLAGRGYVLEIVDGEIGDVPFLLSNDSSLRCVFHGRAELRSEKDEDIDWIFEGPTAIIGRSWLGIASRSSTEVFLDVFSNEELNWTVAQRCYCPEWTDGFDDPAGSTLRLQPMSYN